MQIFAHRGNSGERPENTLPAFSEAIRSGVTGIELDVHLTKDQKLVVIHDETVDRTTNGRGLVREKTLQEIKQLDAGSWFGKKYAGTRIPTLKEVLDLLVFRKFKGVLLIELKTDKFAYNGIEERVSELMRSHSWTFSHWYCSFRLETLAKLAKLEPEVPLDWLLYSLKDNYEVAVHAPFLEGVHLKMISAFDELEQLTSYPKIVRLWTVNHTTDIEKCMRLPIEGIITNYPDRAEWLQLTIPNK